MLISLTDKILEENDLGPDNIETEFYFELILNDIAKYADAKYNEIDISNYFGDALNIFCSAAKEQGLRRGIRIACELLNQPHFNETKARSEYESLTGEVRATSNGANNN